MGLFDKLRKAVNAGATGNKKRLQDETVRQYYEMIYGMRLCLAWSGDESTDENSRARRYVELMLGGPCDEEKFRTAVELTNLARTDHPQTKLEIELKELNKSLKDQNKYKCEAILAYRVCYKELVAEIKAEYDGIIEVIKDNVNCEHFEEGFKKRIWDKFYNASNFDQFEWCVYIVISDCFFEGDPVTRKLLYKFLMDILDNRINNHSSRDRAQPFNIVHAFAMCALHFEQYGKERKGYPPLTDEEYREHIFSCEPYIREINNHPFEKEKYTQCFIDALKVNIFNARFSSYTDSDAVFFDAISSPVLSWTIWSDCYFHDALMNYAWKEIAKEYTECTDESDEIISESHDPIVIADMVLDYVENYLEES